MDILALFGLSVGLAMDALAVSLARGAAVKKLTLSYVLKIAFAFGLFQASMPLLGWCIGQAGAAVIQHVDHWIALGLLGFLGIKMMVESIKGDDTKENDATSESKPEDTSSALSLKTLLLLSIATSIDALATGVLLPSAVGANTVPLLFVSVGTIGAVTFVLCCIGVVAGKQFGRFLGRYATFFGGLVLLAIGIKICVEHLFFS